jgi:imidazolonepropionase-like amidohydrolase
MRTLFTGATVFDGEAFLPQGAAVLVEHARITAVGPIADFDGLDATRLDATGKTVLPGLIDCHIHLCFGAETDVLSLMGQMTDAQFASRALENAQANLRAGVTSVRDLGGMRFVETTIKNEIRSGRWLGPTILSAGRMICITGGHGWFMAIEADGTDAVRAAVRTNVKAGADVIKLMATGGVMTPGVDPLAAHFTADEMNAAVDEARRLGRPATAHALGAPGIRNAVNAGVASVEHGFELDDELIQSMIDRDVVLVPTLSAIGVAERLGYKGFTPDLAERAARYFEMQRVSVKRFYDAGGRLAMGTDAGTPLNRHGENAQELVFMTALGVTPRDALIAATSSAADLCGLSDRGRLKTGAAADLIVVEGDLANEVAPLTDPAKRRLVLKDGEDVGRLLPERSTAWARPLSLEDSPF